MLILSPATLADNGSTYGIIAISNHQNFDITIIDDKSSTGQLSNDKSVAIGLGVGYKFAISNDWQMKTELELSHSSNDIVYINSIHGNQLDYSSKIETNQIWASAYLQNNTYFESINPFIGIGIGAVQFDAELRTPQSTIDYKDWQQGYQFVLGLEFETEKNYSLNLTLKNRQY